MLRAAAVFRRPRARVTYPVSQRQVHTYPTPSCTRRKPPVRKGLAPRDDPLLILSFVRFGGSRPSGLGLPAAGSLAAGCKSCDVTVGFCSIYRAAGPRHLKELTCFKSGERAVASCARQIR